MAKVSGIAIRPGVSANRRLYTRSMIAKATVRLQKRLKDEGAWPVNMFTSHERAGADDARAIGGQLRRVWLTEDGALAYEGETTPTEAGRDVAILATPDANGKQFLRHVSVRAFFLGPVTKDAQGNECADDMEIVGLDFTGRPGVTGTSVTAKSAANASRTESAQRTYITESAEEATFMTTKSKLTTEDLKAIRAAARAGRFTPTQRVAIAEAIDQDDGDAVLAIIRPATGANRAPLTRTSSEEDFLRAGDAHTIRGWSAYTQFLTEGDQRPEAEDRGRGNAYNDRGWLSLAELIMEQRRAAGKSPL